MFLSVRSLALALVAILLTSSAWGNGWSWNFPPQYVNPTSAKRNHIFYVGETVSFNVGAAATRYEVRDYYGNIVAQNAVVGLTVTPNVTAPGWYKLYLYGTQNQGTPWAYAVGNTTFVIFRDHPNFPKTPATDISGGANPLEDEIMRGVTGLGPQRLVVDNASDFTASVNRLEQDIALDETWYLPYDPVRKRDLLVAFPNGTSDLAGVRRIVDHFKNRVKYWEGRNEPNFGPLNATDFVRNEMKPFYDTVKAVSPNLRVLGPGIVSVNQLGWIDNFLNQGGANYIDAFSFHGYSNLGNDLWLIRTGLDSLRSQLAQYGKPNMELWQTEFGHMAAVYGSYQPRHQGALTMLQMMAYEQYGIPKEHNHLWYDKSGGFWDFPTWVENDDGGLNPGAALMRVWSEEIYGLKYQSAFDFGSVGNKIYLGNLFANGGASVAAFLAVGDSDGSVQLRVSSGASVQVVSAFGVETSLPVIAGIATLPINELPTYVHLAAGQICQVVPRSYGENVARRAGVVVTASGAPYPTDPNNPNSLSRLVNGVLENWAWRTWSEDSTWLSNVTSWPATIEIALPSAEPVSDVLIHATAPWQVAGTLLDYELQAWNGSGWTTIEHVVEPAKTFKNYTPAIRCTVDSYFSERHVFEHHFAPVTTNRLRLLVNEVTYGGGATPDVVEAGGQTGPHQISLREIEVYKAPLVSLPVITQSPASQSVALGAALTLSVKAQGGGTLAYVWKKNGVIIPLATQASLLLPVATLATAGTYTAEISNSAGTAISQAATVSVSCPFNSWAANYFPTSQIWNPEVLLVSSPQGDGVSVLQKYYFGLNPLQSASVQDRARLPKTGVETSSSGVYVTLTYISNPQASDVALLPEKGNLFGNWQTAVPDLTTNLSPDPATGNPRVCLKFRVGTTSSGFYRLSLTIR